MGLCLVLSVGLCVGMFVGMSVSLCLGLCVRRFVTNKLVRQSFFLGEGNQSGFIKCWPCSLAHGRFDCILPGSLISPGLICYIGED